MKNMVKAIFSLAAFLFLTCSFVVNPSDGKLVSGSSLAGINEKRVGGAYIFFAGKYGGEITKQEIVGQTEVLVEGCARGSRIIKFTLEVTKGGKTSSFKTDSNVLTTEMRNKLNSLSKGDTFEFKDAKAYWGNSKDDVVVVKPGKFVVA